MQTKFTNLFLPSITILLKGLQLRCSVPLKSTAIHPSTLNNFTTSLMNILWYVSSALKKPEWHTCEYKTKDFAFLYSRIARSYSPLAMFARIMLGRLKRVLKRWSIPCTDLIRSAWACHHTYIAHNERTIRTAITIVLVLVPNLMIMTMPFQ